MAVMIKQTILVLTIMGVGAAVPVQAQGGEYRPVPMDFQLFDAETLGLMDMEREKMANGIAAYVANRFAGDAKDRGGKGGDDLELASRMLAVALQLQPRNRTALVANYQLQRGMPMKPVDTDYSPDLLAEFLYVRSKLLIEQGGRQNDLLAGYLLAFSIELDPTNEDAIYDLELRRVDNKPVEWELLFAPPVKIETPSPKEQAPAPKPQAKPAAPSKDGEGTQKGKAPDDKPAPRKPPQKR